jgi:hypothetical protein
METISKSTKCLSCGEPLGDDHAGPCPKCGGTCKEIHVQVEDEVRCRDSIGWQHVREYWDRHPIILSVVVAITIGSPFLGLVLAGWLGVAVGLAISVASLILGLFAITKVREIREGHEP